MANVTVNFNFPKPDRAATDPAQHIDEAFDGIAAAHDQMDALLKAHADLIAGKSDSGHGHSIGQIVGLTEALAAKMPSNATFTLAGLTDVSGAGAAPDGYVLVKSGGIWIPASAAAAIGPHGHAIGDVTGLGDALSDRLEKSANLDDLTDKGVALTKLGFSNFMKSLTGVANEPALRTALSLYSVSELDNLLAKVATDDIQVQTVSTRVSAVDFTLPATGNMFLILATNFKPYLDAAIGFRTSADGTTFAAGATDYETRYMVNYTSTPTGGGSQGAQGYLHSGTQEADGVGLISATVMGLLMPGSAGAWPTVLSIGGGYNYNAAYDLGMAYNVRRSAGRIAKLRIIAAGTDLVNGRFVLIRIRGA